MQENLHYIGQLAPETEAAGKSLSEGVARFHDLTKDIPGPEDFELKEDVEAEPHPETIDDRPDSEGRPHKIRRRFYRSPAYWQKRSRGEIPPLGSMREHELNQQPFAAVAPEEIPEDRLEPADKRRRVVEIDSSPSYAPTEPPVPLEEEGSQSGFQMHNELDELMPDPGAVPAHLEPETDVNPPESDRPDNTDEIMPEVDSRSHEIEPSGIDVPVPEAGEDELAVTARLQQAEHVFELSIDVHPEDITENPRVSGIFSENACKLRRRPRRSKEGLKSSSVSSIHTTRNCFSKLCKKNGKAGLTIR